MTEAEPLKDPVCGMTVSLQSPHQIVHEGRTYRFRGINDHGQHPHETPQIRWKAHRLANTCVQFDRSTTFPQAV